MRYLVGLVCVLALGFVPLIGCGDSEGTNGSGGAAGMGGDTGTGGAAGTVGGDVRAGLYAGMLGDPFATDGSGWAVCFWVADDTVQLVENTACNVGNIYDDASDDVGYAFQVGVKNGEGTPPGCDFDIRWDASLGPVPIDENGKFSASTVVPGTIRELAFEGTISGTTAFGSASRVCMTMDCAVEWTADLVEP